MPGIELTPGDSWDPFVCQAERFPPSPKGGPNLGEIEVQLVIVLAAILRQPLGGSLSFFWLPNVEPLRSRGLGVTEEFVAPVKKDGGFFVGEQSLFCGAVVLALD